MKKILVIDDSPDVREIVTAILDESGFGTLSAGDGQSGIAAAKEHLPDLVICDVQMPVTDGYGVLNELRQYKPTSTIPFIFLTGLGDTDAMRRGMNLGADDYLSKPFRFDDLIAAVNTRLQKQATVEAASDTKMEALRESISLALPHELLTPLNGILGLSTMLMDDVKRLAPEEIADYARNIHASAERLDRVVGNFVLLSKLELQARSGTASSGAIGRTPSAVEQIRAGVSNARKRHPRSGEVLQLVEDAAVTISPQHLAKIIEEIADNAMKFSPAGAPIRLSARGSEGTYAIEIIDRGNGFTPEAIAQIGSTIQQDRSATEQQGAGLGLAIAKRLLSLSGAGLSVTSPPGKRASVRVELRIADG